MSTPTAAKNIHVRQFVFGAVPPWSLERVLVAPAWQRFWRVLSDSLERFSGSVIWHVNSTAAGGGVAEMLRSNLPYLRGAGFDARWMVMLGSPPFFEVTKRIHNFVHGAAGDGGALGAEERAVYEQMSREAADEFCALVRPADVVVLHDPQTAGLVAAVKKTGAKVIWRCHIGTETPNRYTETAWSFLEPYLEAADAFVFTRPSFLPPFLKKRHVAIITPCIDPFSPKNRDMSLSTVRAILKQTGLISGNGRAAPPNGEPTFRRQDGSPARVDRPCRIVREGEAPSETETLVAQVSRWDRLKDPIGVMEGFVGNAACVESAHLILAGPDVEGVADDPEGAAVWNESCAFWQALSPELRARVHLACLPMRDLEENAAIVNALQRQASVVVQKSLQEGFGLTVTEAMWKSRVLLASSVGGIQDQIRPFENGILVSDPSDYEEFGRLLETALSDRIYAETMGQAAKQHVSEHLLFNRQLERYFDLFNHLS